MSIYTVKMLFRAGSGYLVDKFGFGMVSALVCSLQVDNWFKL